LPSVTLTHVCGTNSHNWWAKGLPGVGVGVVKIFYDSDSSGWKFFRLRLLDSDSTALFQIILKQNVKKVWERRSHAFPPHYTPEYVSTDTPRNISQRRSTHAIYL